MACGNDEVIGDKVMFEHPVNPSIKQIMVQTKHRPRIPLLPHSPTTSPSTLEFHRVRA